MTQSSTTDLAEITAGFIDRFGAIGPLIAFIAPDLKLTVLIKLKDPDKKIFVDLGAKPMKIEVDGPQEKANVVLSAEADMFHYILWGELLFPRAINERIALLEITTGSLPDIPMFGSTGKRHRAPGKNKLYEAYLINIGAGRLLDDPKGFSFPPDPDRGVRTIELEPQKGEGLLARIIYAATFGIGLVGGFGLRSYLKRFEIGRSRVPDIDYVSFDEAFEPLPPPPPRRNGIGAGLEKFFFSRLDVFKLIESMVKGMEASGVLKNPIQMTSSILKGRV